MLRGPSYDEAKKWGGERRNERPGLEENKRTLESSRTTRKLVTLSRCWCRGAVRVKRRIRRGEGCKGGHTNSIFFFGLDASRARQRFSSLGGPSYATHFAPPPVFIKQEGAYVIAVHLLGSSLGLFVRISSHFPAI